MTEDLSGWLMATGTPAELREVIEDTDANEWLGVAALGALGAMAWDGRISREEHHDYVRELGVHRERTDHPLWMEWLSQVGFFAWEYLLDLVAELERAGVLFGKEGVETTRRLMNEPGRDDWARHAFFRYQPGGFAGLERFAEFLCFQLGYAEEDAETGAEFDFVDFSAPDESAPYVPFGTITREEPKIGRNDPCPCGSGKKWKKCCGK
ncbi:MAG TPA: DUF1186 domain-containing protein [Luteolibacter sp.]